MSKKVKAPRALTQRYEEGQRILAHNLPDEYVTELNKQTGNWARYSNHLYKPNNGLIARATDIGRGHLVEQDIHKALLSDNLLETHRIDGCRTAVKRTNVSSDYDIIIAIAIESGLIKTGWYNKVDDQHATLDKKMYINEPIVDSKKMRKLILGQ